MELFFFLPPAAREEVLPVSLPLPMHRRRCRRCGVAIAIVPIAIVALIACRIAGVIARIVIFVIIVVVSSGDVNVFVRCNPHRPLQSSSFSLSLLSTLSSITIISVVVVVVVVHHSVAINVLVVVAIVVVIHWAITVLILVVADQHGGKGTPLAVTTTAFSFPASPSCPPPSTSSRRRENRPVRQSRCRRPGPPP
jgi:hypothetical protein